MRRSTYHHNDTKPDIYHRLAIVFLGTLVDFIKASRRLVFVLLRTVFMDVALLCTFFELNSQMKIDRVRVSKNVRFPMPALQLDVQHVLRHKLVVLRVSQLLHFSINILPTHLTKIFSEDCPFLTCFCWTEILSFRNICRVSCEISWDLSGFVIDLVYLFYCWFVRKIYSMLRRSFKSRTATYNRTERKMA